MFMLNPNMCVCIYNMVPSFAIPFVPPLHLFKNPGSRFRGLLQET